MDVHVWPARSSKHDEYDILIIETDQERGI